MEQEAVSYNWFCFSVGSLLLVLVLRALVLSWHSTVFVQCRKYRSIEVHRESLVRSQVQIIQNEKRTHSKVLHPAVHGSKVLKIHDNLTSKQTKFR